MKKAVFLLIALLFLLSGLSACTPSDMSDDPQQPSDEQQPTHFLQNYTIIHGGRSGGDIAQAADQLISTIQSEFGFILTRATDLDASPAAPYAILIGQTDRSESERAHADLKSNQFTIRKDGDHIVILGYSDALTLYAVDIFMTEILPEIKENGTMPDNYLYNGDSEISYTAISATVKRPSLIQTVYDTDDVVIANVIATEDYGADPTGQTDSTSAIQKALDACAKDGGGTVFLPVGTYLVTKTITVPTGCILRGDWQDPATTDTPAYGTVIFAKPRALNGAAATAQNALIFVSNNAAAIGLTFYYPEQSASKPADYGFTLYAGSYDTMTMQNLTLLNSYRGIGLSVNAEVHEFSQIENIRMTALSVGMHMLCSPDVGNQTDIIISPNLWATATGDYRCPDPDALLKYTTSNGVGMILGDLDDEQFSDVAIDRYHTGIRFVMQTVTRPSSFWGMFYNLNITNCTRGIEASKLYPIAGIIITRGTIEGSEYAISNTCPDGGNIKLCSVQTNGACIGRILKDTSDASEYHVTAATYNKPASHLYVAPIKTAYANTTKDASAKIQETLDKAAQTGGVVYIPAGFYTVKQPLNVPENVELRGVAPIFTRDGRKNPAEQVGTVLISYYTDGPLITLNQGAGVNGLRIWFPQNDPQRAYDLLKSNNAVTDNCVAIKGTGADVYAVNTTVNAAFVGVDFTDCDRHVIDRLYGCCYSSFIIAGGKDGCIESSLSNMHFLQLPDTAVLKNFDPDACDVAAWNTIYTNQFEFIRTTLLRQYCTFITLNDAAGERVQSSFMYAAHQFLRANNSSALLLNVSVDALDRDYPMFNANSSTLTAVNVLRIGGISIRNDNSTVKIINRCSFSNMAELPYDSTVSVKDPSVNVNVSEQLVITDCEDVRGAQGVILEKEPDFVKEGSSSWYHAYKDGEDVILTYTFDATDISDYVENGYLHLWFYVEDYDNYIPGGGQIELTSSGSCDRNEASWSLSQFIKSEGWNELFLPLSCPQITGGEPDFTAVNYIRIFAIGNNCDFYVDDIYVCK